MFFLALSLIPLIIVSVFAFIQSQNALREITTVKLKLLAKHNSATIVDGLEVAKRYYSHEQQCRIPIHGT